MPFVTSWEVALGGLVLEELALGSLVLEELVLEVVILLAEF